jgi:hypothetical protein
MEGGGPAKLIIDYLSVSQLIYGLMPEDLWLPTLSSPPSRHSLHQQKVTG